MWSTLWNRSHHASNKKNVEVVAVSVYPEWIGMTATEAESSYVVIETKATVNIFSLPSDSQKKKHYVDTGT